MTLKKSFLGAFATLALAASASAQGILLVQKESNWRYLDQGQDPGDDWMYLDFDDSAWPEGQGQLGFNEGDENQLIDRGAAPFPTSFFFRHSFDVTAAQLNTLEGNDFFYQLIFELLRDDGAIVYLNEFEIFRSNVADDQDGDPSTVAQGAVGGTAERTYLQTVINGDGILQEGVNVLAVSVHQNSAGSSDLSFDMSMEGLKVAPTFGVYRPPQSINFDQEPRGGLRFNPDPFTDHTDLGWDIIFSAGAQPVAFGITNRDPISSGPFGGFAEGYAFYSNRGKATLTTQTTRDDDSELRYRVDLRNHRNVEVSFDLRTDDSAGGGGFGFPVGNGFETADYVKFRNLTSMGGSDFVSEEVLFLKGGGSGGLNFESVPFIKEADSKKGLVPTNGSLGTTWTEVAFDDSSWHTFTKGMGYDSASTYIPFIGYNTSALMRNRNASCYMRIPFTVDDKDALETLTLYARDDDGFVAYINGARVFDVNGPAAPVWNSSATANNPDSSAVSLKGNNITAHLDKLVNGTNVLAIHCLNQSTSSSDFLVSVELEGTLPNQAPRNDPPLSLNDINFGTEGPFYRYTFPVADSANSYVFECELFPSDLNETIYFDNFSITGDPIEVDSYDAWVKLETPFVEGETAEPLADPDGDGINNFLEYAFGSDPLVASQTMPNGDPILPQTFIIEDGNTGEFFYEIQWRQRDGITDGTFDFPYGGYTVQGIQYLPQISDDLDIWDDGRFSINFGVLVGEPFDNGDGTLTYRMRFDDPILDPNDPDPVFARIYVRTAIPIIED